MTSDQPDTLDTEQINLATWAGYGALCLGMFMAILDIQIVASSLPTIQKALHIDRDNLSWIQTAYLIAEIIAIPLTGWLTRLMSLRGLFVTAVIGFTLASVGCAMSQHFDVLLVCRVIQGFCGGALIPIVFTSVFVIFPKRVHVLATTLGGLFAMLAPTVGPVLGGYITEHYSWHWLFLINVLPGIIVAVIAACCVRTGRPDWTLLRRLDVITILLLALCLTSLELALKDGPKYHWYGGYMMALLLMCPVTGWLLIRRNLKAAEPVIDIRCFAERSFTLGCIYSFVLGMGLFGAVYLTPLFLGFVREHSAFEIGKIMIVMGAAQLLTAPIAALAEKRFSSILLTAFGYALFAAGLFSNGFMTSTTDFDGLLWPQILRGAAVMFCLLPTTALALEGQPLARVSNASGLFNLMRNLGGAIGIALIDTVLEQRTPDHAAQFVTRLQAGDPIAAKIVGLPLSQFHNVPLGDISQTMQDFIAPLVQRAALVQSFNEAWLILGIIFTLTLLLLPFMQQGRLSFNSADKEHKFRERAFE